jgi:hypothetical protein
VSDERYEGMWDFDGARAPREDGSGGIRNWGQQMFSLRCFQWVRKARGKGLKPGKGAYRIKGRFDDPQPAYEAARAYCAKKNAGGSEST